MERKTTNAPARIFIRPEVELTCRNCKHYDNDDCPTIRGKFVPFPAYPCDEFDRNDYPLYGDWNDKKFLLEHVEDQAVVPVPADVQEAAEKAALHYDMGTEGVAFQDGYKEGMLAERERLAAFPTIKVWMARDGHGSLVFSSKKPHRLELWKLWEVTRETPAIFLPNTLFPDLRWEDEPKKVEIIIKEAKK